MARILVVDDDAQVLGLMAKQLQRAGHTVVTAANGLAGVAAVRAEAVDLAVVDLQMPHLNGWATMRELHKLFPRLPFVIVSGGGALEGLEKGTPGTLQALNGQAAYRILLKWDGQPDLITLVDELLAPVVATNADQRR